jgi:4-hydroxybenzoyl-CoA thioesterase/acyl-CoA thioester hydrolase
MPAILWALPIVVRMRLQPIRISSTVRADRPSRLRSLAPMEAIFHTQRRVEFADTDAAGIAHFSVFFTFMEQAEHEFMRARGVSVVIEEPAGMLSWPRVSAHCDFISAVRFEDVLDIELSIARLGSKSVTYKFSFSCGGRPVASGHMTSVCCRFSPDGTPHSIPIPQWIAEKLVATPGS